MPECLVGTDTIFYKNWGAGGKHPLVAIHGAGGSSDHWPDALGTLPDTDVHALDLPGHGRSVGQSRETVAAYAECVASLVETLGLGPVILMGHSMGGAIVQTLAMENPDWLKGIVLVGTGARLRVNPAILDGLASNTAETMKTLLKLIFGPSVPNDLVRRMQQGYLATPAAVTLMDFRACDGFDILDEVGRIRCPTLVVSGEFDLLTTVKYGEFLAKAIVGARHAVLAGAGHMMALEKPDAFIEAVASFLREFS